MITFTNLHTVGYCMKADTKPTTGVQNGDKILEMDTGKVFIFDEEGAAWYEQPSSGGGGGGLPENAFIVTITDAGEGLTCDKTYEEMSAAYSDGKIPYLKYVDSEGEYPVIEYAFTSVYDVEASEEAGVGIAKSAVFYNFVAGQNEASLNVSAYMVYTDNSVVEISDSYALTSSGGSSAIVS